MAKRIQVGVDVPILELEMPGGQIYKWAMDMQAVRLIQEEQGQNALGYLRDVIESFSEDPIDSYVEVLYIGLRSYHPALTREQVAHMFPANQAVMEAVMDGLLSTLPDVPPENPTIPAPT